MLEDKNQIAAEIMARERSSWCRPIAADGSLTPPPPPVVAPAPPEPVRRASSTPPLFEGRSETLTLEKTMPRKATLTPEEKKERQREQQRAWYARKKAGQAGASAPKPSDLAQVFAGGSGMRARRAPVAEVSEGGGGNGDPLAVTLGRLREARAALAAKLARLDGAIELLAGE